MDYKNEPQSAVALAVADRLSSLLREGRKVLWLLSGGSGGKVCVEASKLLAGQDLSNLYVTFSDERYGVLDHPDENYRILMAEGLRLPGASIYRPLDGRSSIQTEERFNDWLTEISKVVDYKFAVMGIGEDGHTAGVKPHSPAVLSSQSAVIYQADDFERLTISLGFVRGLDEAIVQAYGPAKHSVVGRLLKGQGEVSDFPALAIHDIEHVVFYSDFSS